MARNNNNSRITPDSVRDYNLTPATSVVDKQLKYTPQLEEAGRLKATAQGLSDLAKGVTDVNITAAYLASDNALEALSKTKDSNQDKWKEVSKNVKGMAKFNPYNKEVYHTLRAESIIGDANLKYKELSVRCADMTLEEFDNQMQAIQQEALNNLASENIKAKNSADSLVKMQNIQGLLKNHYIEKKTEKDYQIVQNQMITSASKDIATMTTKEGNFLGGWNKAINKLSNTANSIGMDNTKQAELLAKSVNQYLIDNVDEVDPEEFIIAVAQTKINGKSLSDFDPNYTESMKQLLVKAKRAKYEMDELDFNIEKQRLERESLAANAEIFSFMADGTKSDAEIKNKAMEIIEAGGMEAVGFNFLNNIVSDKKTLFNVTTTTTDPVVYEGLMRKYITGSLTQEDIVSAVDSKQLGVADASSLFKALQSDAQESYSEQMAALKELYLDNKPTYDLGEENKANLTKSVYDTISNPNLTKAQKAQALTRIKGVAEHMESQKRVIEDKNPLKLVHLSYMSTQHAHNQSSEEAARALAKMGLFKNQMGWKDANIKVTSPMQAKRTVQGTNGQAVTREHKGTDVSAYLGRAVFAPKTGVVVASGYEKSMGNYVLFECTEGGYIKLMHLQAANLPKAGTHLIAGQKLAHVGNTGFVNTKNTGVLHIECFDKRMRLVDPKQFITGK